MSPAEAAEGEGEGGGLLARCGSVFLDSLMSEGFKARDIGLRAQKKILGRMANKNIAKVFIDDTTSSLLDNVYRLSKAYTGSKKEAEKLVKNVIKIVIKIGVLYRNGQFSAEELRLAEKFKGRFHAAAMAVVSFYEVDFSYDRHYLLTALNESRSIMHQLVRNHLSEKSLNRIDSVFGFFANAAFLDSMFRKDSEHRELLGQIVADMNKAMDEGGM
ncbi:protein salivary glands marred isoform X2 [Bacillus rossius redtenbacheri]|uniref:protein salivary glands marred isoform X2 n=1 Tax=Bacillus rossius redtenbacheri TaxID=93214 RepID=UPI002FDCA0D1